MKLLKSLLIIFLICSSHFIESKLKRKVGHSRVSSKSHTKSTTIDELWDKLKEKQNLVDFVLGALSEWFPSFNEIYAKKKEFLKVAGQCFTTAIFFSTGTLVKEQKSVSTDENWLKLETEEERYDFCVNTKKDIRANYYGDSNTKYLISFIRTPQYCEVSDERKASIIQKYGNLNTYNRECLFFESLDCETIKHSVFTTVKTFLGTAMKYLTGITAVQNCIINIKDIVLKFPLLGDLLESSFKSAIKVAAGLLANYVTGSAWGSAKGSYLLVDLGMKLYDFSLELNKKIIDAFFILGQLVSKAINAGKAFLFGKKKRNHSNRK